jgi:hypothetical protein
MPHTHHSDDPAEGHDSHVLPPHLPPHVLRSALECPGLTTERVGLVDQELNPFSSRQDLDLARAAIRQHTRTSMSHLNGSIPTASMLLTMMSFTLPRSVWACLSASGGGASE